MCMEPKCPRVEISMGLKCPCSHNVPGGAKTSMGPKCPRAEMSTGPKRPGAEMSTGPKCPGAEMSTGPKRPGAETSMGPKCPDRNVSGRNVWDRNENQPIFDPTKKVISISKT